MVSDSALHAACLRYMPLVAGYNSALDALGVWWQKVTLIGKINSLALASTLIDDMQETQRRFEALQRRLIDSLVQENVRKLELEFSARAQMAIDILVRNLFERTADVGFLATDDDIRAFLHEPAPDAAQRERLTERLREYTAKYSVYDEIIVLDPQGRVRVHLDAGNPIEHSCDPLLNETLRSGAPYVETFRPSDLQPLRRVAHIFSAPITASDGAGSVVLGVLCLCFRFDDELRGIFANLARPGEIMAILDQGGSVIASSDVSELPPGSRLGRHGRKGIGVIQHRGQSYLSHTAGTHGYQGYHGLAWQGHVMRPLHNAFAAAGNGKGYAQLQSSPVFSEELRAISRNAALVTDDLTLVVLNGQIVSAKRDAAEFMPVLEEIRNIGHRTRGVFDESIANLYGTVINALLSDVQFQAFLAVDIMDRNLYERANDVRWWALTSSFRELLARPVRSDEDTAALAGVLACINGLYTVYTSLMLFDTQGICVAVSNEAAADWVGAPLPDPALVRTALAVTESRHYAVSPYAPTPLYGDRHTYIYLTSLRDPDDETRVVGGIGIVFDAEPQFIAMLEDALPRDDRGAVLDGAFGLFVGRDGRVIASTRDRLPPGTQLELETGFFALRNGERASAILPFEGHSYAVGAAMSQGYREYKTSGDYSNDVLALIFVPV